MQITIEVPDRLIAVAQEHGLTAERYAERVISTATLIRSAEQHGEERVREARAFIQELSKFSDHIPTLPEDAFTRDSISLDRY